MADYILRGAPAIPVPGSNASYIDSLTGTVYYSSPSTGQWVAATGADSKQLWSSNATLVFSGATNPIISAIGGSSGITLTLPSAVGVQGKPLIKKVDNGAGLVTLATTLNQTIDGTASYALSIQWQYVLLASDGTNWLVIGGN